MKSFKRKYSQTFFKQLVTFLRQTAGTKDLESAYDYIRYRYDFYDFDEFLIFLTHPVVVV